jgi:pimeloyl-ACP methyl ester carboxylesterase
LERLQRHHSVLIVEPRGYGRGAKLAAEAYTADMLAYDLLQACTEAGFERFSVFGYSLTGAVAAWLATVSDRVDAVVAGGFPLAGDYRPILEMVEQGAAAAAADPATKDQTPDFDISAAVAFYRRIAALPPGALIDIPCPLFGFWGGGDGVVDDFIGLENQRAAFTERGLPFRTLGSYGHDETLEHLDLVLPDVADWLAGTNGNP